jgi:hypothetical protein
VVAVLLVLAALLVVHFLDGASSGGSTSGADAAGLSASQLNEFEQDVAQLDKANQVASLEFTAVGSHPSGEELDRVASHYQTALDRYESGIHLIGWPARSHSLLQVDTTHLRALVVFLESASLADPAVSSKWLAQLHGQAQGSQQADNALRESVGVLGTSTFP